MIRKCVKVAAAAISLGLALNGVSFAQTYPSKAVNIIVPLPPGGVADLVGRTLAERLQKKWGQPVVVQNKPGAGSMIGLTELARSAPDGYTLGVTTTAITQAHLLSKNVTYKVLEDFTPISLVSQGPYVLAVAPSVPVKTLQEFINYARANPDKLNYASTGLGPVRFVAEGFMARAKVKLTEIPYKGSAEMTMGLLGGESHVTFDSALNIKPHVDAGKLVALVVADRQRMPLLPDVPAAAEAGLRDFHFSFWNGLLAPAGAPQAVVTKISADVAEILRQPDIADMILKRSGAVAKSSSPAEFRKFIEEEVAGNTSLAQSLGLKPQ